MSNKLLMGIYAGLIALIVWITLLSQDKPSSLLTPAEDRKVIDLVSTNDTKAILPVVMKFSKYHAILDIELLQRRYARATDLLGLQDSASIAEGTAIYEDIFATDLQASFYGEGVVNVRKSGIEGWLELVTTSLGPLGPTQHLIGTQLVDFEKLDMDEQGNITDGKAVLISYLQSWHTLPDAKVWLFLGTYHSKVRFSEGKWKIWQMDLERTVDETRPMHQ